jgi:hypothetical protein
MSQPLEALALANATRTARAAVKRDVRAGVADVAEILADPPACTLSMPLHELLICQYRWGNGRVMRVLRECGLSDSKRIGQATARQRQLVIDRLGA